MNNSIKLVSYNLKKSLYPLDFKGYRLYFNLSASEHFLFFIYYSDDFTFILNALLQCFNHFTLHTNILVSFQYHRKVRNFAQQIGQPAQFCAGSSLMTIRPQDRLSCCRIMVTGSVSHHLTSFPAHLITSLSTSLVHVL